MQASLADGEGSPVPPRGKAFQTLIAPSLTVPSLESTGTVSAHGERPNLKSCTCARAELPRRAQAASLRKASSPGFLLHDVFTKHQATTAKLLSQPIPSQTCCRDCGASEKWPRSLSGLRHRLGTAFVTGSAPSLAPGISTSDEIAEAVTGSMISELERLMAREVDHLTGERSADDMLVPLSSQISGS